MARVPPCKDATGHRRDRAGKLDRQSGARGHAQGLQFRRTGAPAAVNQVIPRTDTWKARAENTAPPASWEGHWL